MNELKVCSYEGNEVRTIRQGDETWWVLKDVCEILDIENPSYVRNRLDEDEVGSFDLPHPQSPQKTLEMVCINESGLYNVILRSDKPEAKKFKRWVTHEVLPSIRKHGGYIPVSEADTDDSILAKAVLIAQKTIDAQKAKITELHTQAEVNRPKVIFADAVAASKTTILVGEMAKILKQNGVEMGQNRMFEWLRVNGYLINRRGTDYNMPTQRSMALGLFEIKETSITHADGHISISKTPKITGKGQLYFVGKFRGRG